MHGCGLWSLFAFVSTRQTVFPSTPGNPTARRGVRLVEKENEMIGKIIGAIAGSKVAKHTSGVSEPFGAVAGLVTASALRRISLPAIIVLGAGGYFAKKYYDKRQARNVPYRPVTVTAPVTTTPAKQHPLPA
jgi:hypothetical protein